MLGAFFIAICVSVRAQGSAMRLNGAMGGVGPEPVGSKLHWPFEQGPGERGGGGHRRHIASSSSTVRKEAVGSIARANIKKDIRL